MDPIKITLMVFACAFGGTMPAMALRSLIPAHHRSVDSKDFIKLSVGLIGAMTALVLGVLVASAKGSYDTRRAELTQMATTTILLDRVLAHYGQGSIQRAAYSICDQPRCDRRRCLEVYIRRSRPPCEPRPTGRNPAGPLLDQLSKLCSF